MADKKEKKEFKAGLYSVVSGIIIAVILVALTIFAFTTRYTAFSPDKVAQSYTDGIVQTGDGYNAYKTTLVSKNPKIKYGDFIRRAYMVCYVNDGEDVKQADFVGTGNDKEQESIDKVYSAMYDYYVELMGTYGWDDYDSMFSKYFEKLVQVRHEVYGDDYMDTEFMFGALEANVQTYSESLTGTDRVFASDNKTVLVEETEGAYQKMFGEEQEVEAEALVEGKKKTVTETKKVYKLTTTVTETKEYSDKEVEEYVKAYKERITPVSEMGKAKVEQFGLKDDAADEMTSAFEGLNHADEITGVAEVTCEVKDQKDNVVATQTVFVVQIGNSWYVDNTSTQTTALYLAK